MKLKILLLILLLLPVTVLAIELPNTYSDKILLYDLTEDKVLQEKNITDRSNIASLTKIVTTITAIETIDDLDKDVTITSEMLKGIPWDASLAGLKEGEIYSVRDLLYASILPSGADATQALAYTSAGSISSFVDKMNDVAKKVGAENTHFVNTTGYDIDNHYSTVEDLLKIIKYSLSNAEFKTIFMTKEKQLKNGKVVKWTVDMYNKTMNLDVSRILGSKTGYTKKAGLCIACLYTSHEHDMLLITLGARPYVYGDFYNLKDAVKLIEFTDDNYENQTLIESNSVIKTIPVINSKNDTYEIKTGEDIKKFLPNDYDREAFKAEYEGVESISFITKENSLLGKIKYFYDDELIYEEEVTLLEKQPVSISKVLKKFWWIIVLIVFLLVVKIISRTERKKRKKRH